MASDSPPEPDRLDCAPHPAETALIFGQDAVARVLARAEASGRLHHAWLLRGLEGVGKASFAYGFARRLLAEGRDPAPVAARIRAGTEPGLRVLRRSVNESTGRLRQAIGIDEVRLLKGFLTLSLPDGGRRVVIVDPAEELTQQAANALLKMLEEPPPRTVFLLVSQSPERLLPTIRSRCSTLSFHPLGMEDLARALAQAGHPLDAAEAARLTALSGGSVRQAIVLEQGDGLSRYAELVGLLAGGGLDRAGLAALAETVSGRGRETVYPLVCRLTLELLARLARAGAIGPPEIEAAPDEARLMAAGAACPAQGRLWAEAMVGAARGIRHAQAVNLDPGQTILDTYLALEKTLAAARRAV
ncbi:MAG: DNA polymerase III subunit delta' [Pikeienuella sp.]